MTPSGLPIDAALPALLAALDDGRNAVLVAPPGAGKTTVVPLALLDRPWLRGQKIILLEPRRLAARAAAARMAATLAESVGQRVGLRVRLETRVSRATRIEVVTEGVFTRLLLDDPELDGIGAVLFDEIHERSLDGDLGLALALDSQAALRPDLRLVAMSATIDGGRYAGLLGNAPVVESAGRMFPVETRHLGRDPRQRIEDQVTVAIMRALDTDQGSILCFLPGAGEIRRVEERLLERIPRDVIVAPLYGAMEFAAQDRAVEPAPPGRRKIVLATAIAETSLTIQGVRVVIDAGLARVPRYDPATGMTGLATERVSRAAADQRRGRAGRVEPGICYRLWDEAGDRALMPFARPEILDADLGPLALALAEWGVMQPDALAWLDVPPAGAWQEAVALLLALGALDADGHLTAHGRALAKLPLSPRLAHMILGSGSAADAGLAALVGALLGERGLGGRDTDLRHRIDAVLRDRSGRAVQVRRMAEGWTRDAGFAVVPPAPTLSAGTALARAYPDRIARARPGKPGEFLLANGRGAFIDEADALARQDWLAVGELADASARARILLAAPLAADDVERAFADQIATRDSVMLDERSGLVRARRQRVLGAIVLAEEPLAEVPAEQITSALLRAVAQRGLESLPWEKGTRLLRQRLAFMHRAEGAPWPDVGDAALLARLADWLGPFLAGRKRLSDIDGTVVHDGMLSLLPWELRRQMDALAPSHFTAPTGSGVHIDYGAEAGPTIAIRVQELFGLREHPKVGTHGIPLVIELLSPAHRPIQVTRDLPGFWRGSWAAVRSDMRGRYPRHVWPEDPAQAEATRRAKPRGT